MARKTALDMLNRLASDGKSTFSTAMAVELIERTPQSTVNLLSRLVNDGLITRVSRGHYAIRPFGSLGTSAAAEDVALAVASGFEHRQHRIAYRSALAHHGFLTRPARVIQVACDEQVRMGELAGRPIHLVRELTETLLLGSVEAGYGATVSTLERALIDGARRLDLVGGLSVLAEALEAAAQEVDSDQLRLLAREVNLGPAIRRLASLARVLGLEKLAKSMLGGWPIPKMSLPADGDRRQKATWHDDEAGVFWASRSLEAASG